MSISKIGSKTTYHKCLVELSEWKYIDYQPSHNPMKGSLINLYTFGTSTEQVSGQVLGQLEGQVPGQVLVPSINSNKQNKHLNILNFIIPKIEEIKDYFLNDIEAEKFLNYYDSNGWMVGKSPMKNWKAAANNWKVNMNKYAPKLYLKPPNNLHVEVNKDYSIPL